MINGNHITLPSEGSMNLGIPLLDDEFDIGVEDILDHSDILTLPTQQEEEEFLI